MTVKDAFKIILKSLQQLKIEKGDLLIFYHPSDIKYITIEEFRMILSKYLKGTGASALVLPEGYKIKQMPAETAKEILKEIAGR